MASKKKEVSQMAMLTLSQASAQYSIKKPELKRVIENSKYAAIFTQPDNVKVTHFHAEVPDLIEINPLAIDAYLEAKAHGSAGKRARTEGRPRKHTLYIPDAVNAAVNAALEPFYAQGVSLEAAYKPRKSATPVVAESTTNGTVDLIEDAELISA